METELIQEALRALAQRCPRLVKSFYWAGTSAISAEELGHRPSLDLVFHTLKALADVRPLLAEIQKAFPGAFEVLDAPDEFGSGFRGVLTLPGGRRITVEALSGHEDVPSGDLVASATAPRMKRVALARYLADKIQCVAERTEARDLVDVHAVLDRRPELVPVAKRIVKEQDAVLLAERLHRWSDDEIARDLAAYAGVDPAHACRTRDRILEWLKEDRRA